MYLYSLLVESIHFYEVEKIIQNSVELAIHNDVKILDCGRGIQFIRDYILEIHSLIPVFSFPKILLCVSDS